MAQEKLIDLPAGKLGSGVFPSQEPAAGETWRTGQNIWFREMSVEQVLGRQKIIPVLGRSARVMTQAFTSDQHKRIYYEDFGLIRYSQDLGAPIDIGSLNTAGDYDLETWGDWLIATDGISNLKYWPNIGSLVNLGDAAANFNYCKIIKRLAQHLLAYNTNFLPTGFHWCDANDPTVWTPDLANSARNLNIRNLDSEIVAVCNLGAAHGVYSRDSLIVVQYVGPNQWFGTPNQALSGIGAVSKHSVVSVGQTNYGLSRSGIFSTDGVSSQYIDRPAIDKWLQENVDWSRQNMVAGFYNDRLGLVVWSVPLLTGGVAAIGVDPKIRQATAESLYLGRKTFTYLDNKVTYGIDRIVFDNPIVALADGIYLESLTGTLAANFALTSNLLDAGSREIFKSWDYAILPGTYGSDAQVRFGFADEPLMEAIDWGDWTQLQMKVPFPNGPRESIFLAMDFRATQGFKLSAITVYGEKGGFVN